MKVQENKNPELRNYSIHIIGDESLLNGIVLGCVTLSTRPRVSRAVRQAKNLTTCPAPQRKNSPRPAPRLQQAKYSKILFRCSAPEQPSLTGVILGNLRGGRVLNWPKRERVFSYNSACETVWPESTQTKKGDLVRRKC